MSAALGRMNLAGQPNQAVTYQPPAYPQYQRQAAGPVKSSANFAPAPASPLHIAAEDFKLFEASQLNRGNSSSANTNTMQISPSSNASQGIYGTNVNAPSPFGFATMNPLMNATMSSHWVSPMLSIQSTPQYATPAEQQTVQDLDSGVGISDAAFDAAFGAFDEGEFETELDKWMTEHGPTAERLQHAAGVPTAEEWAEIDKDLEQIAKETETRDGQLSVGHEPQQESQVLDGMTSKQTDENMKKAAADIIRSVADNDSAKFQKSSFFDLMRRIANAEVTVADNTFVDVETGAEVVTRPGDDVDPTDDYSSVPGGGLTENNGSGKHQCSSVVLCFTNSTFSCYCSCR